MGNLILNAPAPGSSYIPPDPLGPDFLTVKIMDDFFRVPKSLCYFMIKHPPLREKSSARQVQGMRRMMKLASKMAEKCDAEEAATENEETRGDASRKRKLRNSRKRVISEDDILTLEETIRKSNWKKKPQKIVNVDDPSLDVREAEADERQPATSQKKKRKNTKRRKIVKYECASCSMSFLFKRQYKRHMMEHSALYKCDACDKAFKRKFELKRHMDLHSGAKFSCDECNFVTSNKVSVRTHVRRVHQRDFRYKCDQCDKSFMSNCELKDHRNCHLGEKSFVCEMCGKAYVQKSHLVAHKRTVHGVVQRCLVKQHRCEICEKKFSSEYILRKHAGVHGRKFLCTHCGNEFATNHGLQLHSYIHTGERPFKCKYCPKSFTRPNTLRLHKLTHTGERPYVCDICGQSFTQRSSMIGHRKKHPGVHPPPPPTLLPKSEDKNNGDT